MKKLMLVVVGLVIVGGVFYYIAKDNQNLSREIYTLLEKDVLTQDELDRVDKATDPDFAKDGVVALDETHAKMFEEHFGHKR